MIDSFTAFTHELDDVESAVAELLAQLDLGGAHVLKENSVGIVTCFAEYLDSGVFSALCEALPFDLIGTTTISNTTGSEIGETMLSLMVLTSDSVHFATALSAPVTEEAEAPLHALYQDAASKLPDGKPALMLSVVPLLTSFGSDYYVERMSEISGNVPNFGVVTVDHNPDYKGSRTLLNGEAYPDRFAILLFHGPIEPLFFVGAISSERVFAEKGLVTAASGNQLHEINGKKTVDFLEGLGLPRTEDGNISGINTFPIMVDYNDGTIPVARAMFALTPDGSAVCGGNIPVGATLSIGSFDPEEIMATARRTLETASEADRRNMIAFSCIGRYFTQGYDTRGEFEALQGLFDPKGVRYTAAYGGGELCPVYDPKGGTINRNHNNTMIVCLF